MAPTLHKPIHVKTKQQNMKKLQQLFLKEKTRPIYTKKYSRMKFPSGKTE